MKISFNSMMQSIVNFVNFFRDFKQYNKYNYGGKNTSFEALQGKIYRQTHIIEKGMSLSEPRKGFGKDKIRELLQFLKDFDERGYLKTSAVFLNAINVLDRYVKFQEKMDYNDENIDKIRLFLNNYSEYIDIDSLYGVMEMTKEQMIEMTHKDFLSFVDSRHSMRQFSNDKVDIEAVKKAIKIAMRAPSECNRQSVKVYLLNSKEKKKQLDEIISGNTGFSYEVCNYLIITSDVSSYTMSYERNQMYVDGALFSMMLMLGLHYYEIGSCALQHSETKEKNEMVKKIAQIPDNEVVVMYIAYGKYKDKFNVAVSKRKNLSDVLICR